MTDHEDELDGAGDHGEDTEHDDHAHPTEELGPVDVTAWGAGAVGVALGLVVAACLAFATGFIG
jgi:hypothetical protein